MAKTHGDRIREAFTRQAGTFEDERLNVAFTSGLPWLLSHVEPRPDDVVLDVAAGTGIVSRALAPDAARVVAVDSTEAMIEQGRSRVVAEGHLNLGFVRGAAEDLPFSNQEFSLVVTRFSLHHFADPPRALREMVRVLRRAGRLVVMDLVASTDPTIAARQDHVERLRDASHVRMPPRGAVRDWLQECGLEVAQVAERQIDRPVKGWLQQSKTDEHAAAQVRAALEADVAGGENTGLRPHAVDGELWFHQTWELTVARGRARDEART
ncbi:class I SAM-dependent methyltransferase [Intrasporangium calvum]|uniref:Methyltransferase type 11 n=1 Tax=Intrasporangium calvum (strain ATCC 23552 / DSM 43043 / JCM 3097 / NBRC 12989 / NCIMB 10167 / NRRL B-3866 / 7 KIP) TaxID=710696 RepID=E6SBY3_INTC7|nr:methyltransferase domain-containing protein [Intrasporangium calvum]ADU49523.1 Methyltransferase type 11 [Intrasporangium calvum DSM 43043]